MKSEIIEYLKDRQQASVDELAAALGKESSKAFSSLVKTISQMERKHQTARLRLLQELMANRTISWEAATKRLKVPSSVISKLESDGVLKACFCSIP